MFVFEEKDLLEYATRDDVYTYCNHYDLFRHYVGDFKLGKPRISPLDGENNPSFSIYVKGGLVLYNDFRLGGGDIITFVMKMYGLTFRESINKIIYDSGLQDKFKTELNYVTKRLITHDHKIKDTKVHLRIKSRKSAPFDLDFWNQFGIGKETLNKYHVTPLEYIFINDKIFKAEKYAYAFKEFKDDNMSLTIYQPYSKYMKWIKSHDHSVFYGWSQLPDKGEKLIITKSLKDVMTIDSITGIPTTSLQSEKVKPKPQVMQELKDRFDKVYLLYDNDWDKPALGKPNYGREFGKTIADEYGLIQIEVPDLIAESYKAKDISDLSKNAGSDYVNIMLHEDIENYRI